MNFDINRIIFEDFSDSSDVKTKKFIQDDIVKLADLKLKVTAELGTHEASVGEVSNYKVGDYIEVDRKAGHTVDVYVGQVKIAIGEIVEMENNKFGLKIMEVLDDEGKFLKEVHKNGDVD